MRLGIVATLWPVTAGLFGESPLVSSGMFP